ncbi:hypothetical protein [Mycoplasma sp. 1654_15]|uniref:hypothetical protein n=1 Tax=Mycoplasma sp. 1654_15 TaxID=2725994 RepID=UPI001448E896|nr:hypothetical protein [Mycoplasma sp. 1654_15]QJB71032.1 hypothetical protein HF996_00675 [Mycoplasma sp. 1654_15]
MITKINNLTYSSEKEYGEFVQFKLKKAETTLFYSYLSDDEIKLYFGLTKGKIREEDKKRIGDFQEWLNNKIAIYIWISNSGVYIGQSREILNRIQDHFKKEEIKKIWIFGIQNPYASTDLLLLLENKFIWEFQNNKIQPDNKLTNNETNLSESAKKDAKEIFELILFASRKIFLLDFIKESKKFKTLFNEKLSETEKRNEKLPNFNFTKGLIKDFFDANNNLTLTFKYPDSSKKIFFFIKDSQNITIKKDSYIWSIKSEEFKNLPLDLQNSVTKFRLEFLKSDSMEVLSKDIVLTFNRNRNSLEKILMKLTCYKSIAASNPYWDFVFEEDYKLITDENGIYLSDLVKNWWLSKKSDKKI